MTPKDSTIYGLRKARYGEVAFDGSGSMRSDGRWHRAGIRIVYASDTPSAALLELVAHTEAAHLLSLDYVFFTIDFDPDRHLLVLTPDLWPPDWRALDWPGSTQRIGTQWFQDVDSVILQVPSAIVPQQHNYLINPVHPRFEEMRIEGPTPFKIDSRLA